MTVVFYDTNKGEHRTIKNVYSVLDDKDDACITVCWEAYSLLYNEEREYSKDIPKELITSINAF